MTSINREKLNDNELKWIQITASVVSLIGMVGLLALMTQSARAETGGSGFKPGNRPFNSPFNNPNLPPPPPNPENFFDDEEEDTDFPMSPGGAGRPTFNPPPASGAPSSGRPSGGGFGSAPPPSGVAVGSGAPNGVVPSKRATPIHLDAETGEGSKEVVTDFNFPDADILDIAKTLGKLTGKNFILDKEVKGRITIISNSPITVSDAWKAFLTALDMNGFALIPSGSYIRIARQRDARDKQLKTYTGDFSPETDALITRVFPLKYIDAEEVARTFRSFMPANSRIIPYDQTNTVIVTDTGSNIAKLSKMLEILDVEGYDVGIEVIPVKYASAAELSKLIDTLVPGTGGAPAPGGAGGPRFGRSAQFSARRTKEGGVINTIIADERTNTLIVHANGKGADQVRELVAKLDQKQPALRGGGRVHVVYLQFAEAEAIANTLNNLSQSAGPSGFKPVSPAGGGGTGTNPVAAALFEGAIKVSPDKATNSLVVTASPADFVTVQRVINRLDIPRDEVFVEATIMEVALTRGFTFSTNVINPTSGIGVITNNDLYNFIANPLGSTGAVIGFKSGSTVSVPIPGGGTTQVSSVQGLIRAIQTNTKSNVLANPQIIALDNSEANFESAELLPYPTSTAVNGAVSSSIAKEKVALSIKIKPQINKISNFVKLDITTKLGDVSNRLVPQALQSQAFATLERSAQTTVVVGDSDTVVIGGLMRDKVNETVSKIPILGDIPLLGWLFRAKDTSVEKTNLLIFITPHIVRQYEKVRALLDKKLKERDDFIETNAGGDDPLRYQRDNIIRNLPDINELNAKRPQTTVTLDPEEPAAREVEQPSGSNGNPFSGSSQGTPTAPSAPQNPPQGSGEGAAPVAPPAGPQTNVMDPTAAPGGNS